MKCSQVAASYAICDMQYAWDVFNGCDIQEKEQI